MAYEDESSFISGQDGQYESRDSLVVLVLHQSLDDTVCIIKDLCTGQMNASKIRAEDMQCYSERETEIQYFHSASAPYVTPFLGISWVAALD